MHSYLLSNRAVLRILGLTFLTFMPSSLMTQVHVNAEQPPPPLPDTPDDVDYDPMPVVQPDQPKDYQEYYKNKGKYSPPELMNQVPNNNPGPEDTPAEVKPSPAAGRKCSIPPPKKAIMNPTMIASYPGSGAKLTWKLIRAISGYMTSDDAVDLDGLSKSGTVIAIKTHYPARGSNGELFAPYENIPRSVLLIRNPLNAIPSFHSYIYEQSLRLTGHSVRAPVDKWIAWRNRHFDTELDYWVKHTKFWMDHHPFEQRLILPYDYLILRGSGPVELRKLRTFLENNGKVEMRTPPEDVACIWDFIVMKRADQGTKVGSMRTGGPTVWPYTPGQIEKMIDALEGLKAQYPGQLGQLMEMYIYHVKDAAAKMTTTKD